MPVSFLKPQLELGSAVLDLAALPDPIESAPFLL